MEQEEQKFQKKKKELYHLSELFHLPTSSMEWNDRKNEETLKTMDESKKEKKRGEKKGMKKKRQTTHRPPERDRLRL